MKRSEARLRAKHGPRSAHEVEALARPELSIVIVNWNAREVLLACLGSLREAALEIALEVTVIDNASSDGSAAAVADGFPEFHLLRNRANAGFGRANNQGFGRGDGRYVLLLNPDTLVTADALRALVRFMDETPDAGAAGPQLRSRDGGLETSFDAFPSFATELLSKHLLRLLFPKRFPSKRSRPDEPTPVELILGACMILRRDLLRQLAGFDEKFFLFMEDADLCWRVWQAGFKVYYLPDVDVCHVDHPSKSQALNYAYIEYVRSKYIFFDAHYGRVEYWSFRVLAFVKLLAISLPLSLIGVGSTLGRAPRQVRRLRIRSRLAGWHLLGCPPAWGMREVSDYGGYERSSLQQGDRTRLLICWRHCSPKLRGILENLDSSVERGASEVEMTKRGHHKTAYRVRVDEAPPRDLAALYQRPVDPTEAAAASYHVRITTHGARNVFQKLSAALRVSKPLREFDRGLESVDKGIPALLPLAAGSLRSGRGLGAILPLEELSFIAFVEDPTLDKLMSRLGSGDARCRGWLDAYGRFVRRLHDAGFSQQDLNPGNAGVRRGARPDESSIVLLDLERVSTGLRLDVEARRQALALLNRIAAGIRRTDRLRFLRGYLAADDDDATEARAARRDWALDLLARMPALHAAEGRRAARTCVMENWLFGRLDAGDEAEERTHRITGHFRKRAHPWDETLLLDAKRAAALGRSLVRGEVPTGMTLRRPRGRGLQMWREANRDFQSLASRNVPLLYVAGSTGEALLLLETPPEPPSSDVAARRRDESPGDDQEIEHVVETPRQPQKNE